MADHGRIFMDICKLNILEYYIAFAGYHTALSNRYSAQAQSGGCIYGAKENGSYAGFLCISDDVDVIRITYALTLPEYRNTGVFTALVKHVTENSRSDIRIGFSSEHPYSEWMRKAVHKTGFVPTEKVTVFSCSREDEPNWQSFMEKRARGYAGHWNARATVQSAFRRWTKSYWISFVFQIFQNMLICSTRPYFLIIRQKNYPWILAMLL